VVDRFSFWGFIRIRPSDDDSIVIVKDSSTATLLRDRASVLIVVVIVLNLDGIFRQSQFPFWSWFWSRLGLRTTRGSCLRRTAPGTARTTTSSRLSGRSGTLRCRALLIVLLLFLLERKDLFIVLKLTLFEVNVLRLTLQSYLFPLDLQSALFEPIFFLLVAELSCRELSGISDRAGREETTVVARGRSHGGLQPDLWSRIELLSLKLVVWRG
jgi:hypothetical protein